MAGNFCGQLSDNQTNSQIAAVHKIYRAAHTGKCI